MGDINNSPFLYYEYDLKGTKGEPGQQKFALIRNNYFYQLYNIAMNRYKWKLPKEVHPYAMENYLIQDGFALFAYDDEVELFTATQVRMSGEHDIYGYPIDRYAYFSNLPDKRYGKNDSVLMRDKPICYPLIASLTLYADLLAKMWMTRNMNLYALRTPFFVSGSQDDMMDAENLFRDYDGFSPLIKMKNGLNQSRPEVLQTGVTPIFNDIALAMRQAKIEVLADMGIECNPIEKTERVTFGETMGNVGVTESARNIGLDVRKRSVEQINETFKDLLLEDVEVSFNSDLKTMVNGFLGGEYGNNYKPEETINNEEQDGDND